MTETGHHRQETRGFSDSRLGFFVCTEDLENVLIRALGAARVAGGPIMRGSGVSSAQDPGGRLATEACSWVHSI